MGSPFKNMCKGLISFMNFLIIAAGLAIVAVSISVLVNLSELEIIDSTTKNYVVWVSFSIGIGLFMIGFIGCCATIEERRCLVGCFAFLQFFFGCAIFVAGLSFIFVDKYLYSVSAVSVTRLLPGVQNLQWYFSDVETGMYAGCCVSSPSFFDSIKPCSNFTTNAFDAYCYRDQPTFIQAYKSGSTVCKSLVVDLELCVVAKTGSGALLKEFQGEISDYSKSGIFPAGVVFVSFGGLLLLCFVGSCYISCCSRRSTVEEGGEYPAGYYSPNRMEANV